MSKNTAPKELVALMRGTPMGDIIQSTSTGKVSFSYRQAWLDEGGAAISLSMPTNKLVHEGPAVANFLWGLLPDNPISLSRIALDGSPTSAGNIMGLLDKVGDDCAGAIQIVAPERVGCVEVKKDGVVHGDVEWLTTAEVKLRLNALRFGGRYAAGSAALRNGRHSLAGAQPKIALFREGDRWGIPMGRVPTTHILKVPIPELEGQVENEHFCLELSRALGMETASSDVVNFDGEQAIAVARYDRWTRPNGDVMRLHQEDMCQAMGLHPNMKYQSDKGPNAKMIAEKVLSSSAQPPQDRRAFLKALMFNTVILGTDAHAKNYAILYGKGGMFKMAPLYDLNSHLPYADGREKLCMTVAGNYEPNNVMPRHWARQARDCGVPSAQAMADMAEMMQMLPQLCLDVERGCRNSKLGHPVIAILRDRISRNANRILAQIRNTPADELHGEPKVKQPKVQPGPAM